MTQPPAREVLEAYFNAMRRGPDGARDLYALFAEDAIYIEPFADGERRRHEGIEAIRACFEDSWQRRPPELTLQVERIDLQGAQLRASWVCDSPAFEAPVRGEDLYEIEGGLICRLEVRFTP